MVETRGEREETIVAGTKVHGTVLALVDANHVLIFAGWSSSDGQIQIPSSVSPPPRFAILDADANFAAWATRSRSEGVPPYPALMNPSPSNDLRHPGLLGYARSRSEFLVAASILIVFGILLIIVGALCMADPSGHIHPFGGFGGFLGIPLVFFGCMFIALTINANSYFPTITHRQGLPSSSFL